MITVFVVKIGINGFILLFPESKAYPHVIAFGLWLQEIQYLHFEVHCLLPLAVHLRMVFQL